MDNPIIPQRKKSPLPLVGAVATAGVLAMGLAAFRKGQVQRSQNMMRARVLFQGVTVALMVATSGFVALGNTNEAQPQTGNKEVLE